MASLDIIEARLMSDHYGPQPRQYLGHTDIATRIVAVERGELADGPELFADLPDRPMRGGPER